MNDRRTIVSLTVLLFLVVAGPPCCAGEAGVGEAEPSALCRVTVRFYVLDEEGTRQLFEERAGFLFTCTDETKREVRRNTGEGVLIVELEPGQWRVERQGRPDTSPYFCDELLEIPQGAAAHQVDVVMRPVERFDVEGVLLNEDDGSPVRGVRIHVSESRGGFQGDWKRFDPWTDEHGRFLLPRVCKDSSYTLRLPDFLRGVSGSSIEVRKRSRTLSPEEIAAGSFVWRIEAPPEGPLVKIRVFVEKEGERKPFTPSALDLEKERMWWRVLDCAAVEVDPDTGLFSIVRTGSPRHRIDWDGVCYWRNLRPGTYGIRFLETDIELPDGGRSFTSAGGRTYYPVDDAFTFTVPEKGGGVVELDTVIAEEQAEFKLRGKVQTPRGRPIRNAKITLRGTSNDGEVVKMAIRSERDGSFEVDCWAGWWSIHVDRLFYTPCSKSILLVPGMDAVVTLKGEPGRHRVWLYVLGPPVALLLILILSRAIRRLRSRLATRSPRIP